MNRIACGAVALISFFISGCAVVEMSGRMTRLTGEIMTDYADNHTGIIAAGARFGGKVNTAVGQTVEGIAKKGEDDTGDSKIEQFVDANKEVMTAAANSVKDDETTNVRVQKRLQALGYDIGRPDGTIGPKTKKALGDYQKRNGLQVTQIPDNSTLAALEIQP